MVLTLILAAAGGALSADEWSNWRGPFNTGMAIGDAPLRWSDSENVRWKTAIPGRGHSTPVIAGGRLFLTTAVPTGRGTGATRAGRAGGGADSGLEHQFEVIAIDRVTGQVAWQRTAATATPHEGYHQRYGSFASNSPVTDGERVFAFFGSRGLYAYDLGGAPLWQKDFQIEMRMDMAFGEGSALTLHDNRLLLHFDHLGGGFLVMLDPETGREIWRTPRTEKYNWAAPYVVNHAGRKQVVVNGLTVRGYEFETGKLVWEVAGLGENSIPQPVQFEDLVYAMSGHTTRMIMAIRLGRTGNLTGTDAIAWSTQRGAPYTPSPLLHGDRLYVVTESLNWSKDRRWPTESSRGQSRCGRRYLPGLVLGLSKQRVRDSGTATVSSQDDEEVCPREVTGPRPREKKADPFYQGRPPGSHAAENLISAAHQETLHMRGRGEPPKVRTGAIWMTAQVS